MDGAVPQVQIDEILVGHPMSVASPLKYATVALSRRMVMGCFSLAR